MKKNKINLILLLSFFCIGTLVFVLAVAVNADSTMQEFYNYKRINENSGYCVFNGENIISDINNNFANLFITPESEFEYINPHTVTENNGLSLHENEEVIEAFVEQFWNDKIDNWNIIRLKYSFYNCENITNSIYGNEYVLEKNSDDGTFIRKIFLMTWQDTIQWNQYEEIRPTSDEVINLNDIKYDAYDAVTLCQDEFIGEQFKCSNVSVIMGKSAKPIWDIYFYSDVDETIHCTVNAVTGKVRQRK